MENLQAYIVSHAPPTLVTHLTTHSRTYWRIYQTILAFNQNLYTHFLNPAAAVLAPLLSRITTNPDVASIALLLVLLFVSFKALGLFVRSILFWVRMTVRLVFWATIAGLGMWLYTRGVEGVGKDLGYWANVWKQEYDYYQGQHGGRAVRRGGGGVDAGGIAGAWW